MKETLAEPTLDLRTVDVCYLSTQQQPCALPVDAERNSATALYVDLSVKRIEAASQAETTFTCQQPDHWRSLLDSIYGNNKLGSNANLASHDNK